MMHSNIPPQTRSARGDDETTIVERHGHVPSFSEAAVIVREWSFRNLPTPRSAEQSYRTLEIYAFPHVGSFRVSDIQPSDVLTVLAPIWIKKHPTALKLRGQISAVMRWAMAIGFRADNPVGEIGAAGLPRVNRSRDVSFVVPHNKVAGIVAAVRTSHARSSIKLAFEFLVLTAARSSEVRGARWDDIDRDRVLWRVSQWKDK